MIKVDAVTTWLKPAHLKNYLRRHA